MADNKKEISRAEAWDRYAYVLGGADSAKGWNGWGHSSNPDAEPTDAQIRYAELLAAQTFLLRAISHLQNTKPYSLYVTRFDAMNVLQEIVKEMDAELQSMNI